MEYIRTKNGRIIYINKASENVQKILVNAYERKQVDTIKELCDFIAIVSEKQIYDVEPNIQAYFEYEYERVLPEAKAEYPEEHWFMYLGILTDKGLIFVAKMNDNGDLELI